MTYYHGLNERISETQELLKSKPLDDHERAIIGDDMAEDFCLVTWPELLICLGLLAAILGGGFYLLKLAVPYIVQVMGS